jgi:hypothetical protein
MGDMSEFQAAMLLRILCEIESLVSEREGMIAANQDRSNRDGGISYDEKAFADNAAAFRAIAPDPHHFA